MNPIHQDLSKLKGLLKDSLEGQLAAGADLRILNLACGRCDEAETLISVGQELTGEKGAVEMVGADIRIREIRQARERHVHLPAEFLIEDASQLSRNKACLFAKQRIPSMDCAGAGEGFHHGGVTGQ